MGKMGEYTFDIGFFSLLNLSSLCFSFLQRGEDEGAVNGDVEWGWVRVRLKGEWPLAFGNPSKCFHTFYWTSHSAHLSLSIKNLEVVSLNQNKF